MLNEVVASDKQTEDIMAQAADYEEATVGLQIINVQISA
jgi:hypothetical protein